MPREGFLLHLQLLVCQGRNREGAGDEPSRYGQTRNGTPSEALNSENGHLYSTKKKRIIIEKGHREQSRGKRTLPFSAALSPHASCEEANHLRGE